MLNEPHQGREWALQVMCSLDTSLDKVERKSTGMCAQPLTPGPGTGGGSGRGAGGGAMSDLCGGAGGGGGRGPGGIGGGGRPLGSGGGGTPGPTGGGREVVLKWSCRLYILLSGSLRSKNTKFDVTRNLQNCPIQVVRGVSSSELGR